MSKIDELIQELCPDGVEYRNLGAVVQFRRGTTITKQETTPGNIPVVAGGQKPSYFHSKANRDGETITVAGSGAYAGFISFWRQPIFVSDAFTVEPDLGILIPRFVYHFLKNLQEDVHQKKTGGGIPHVYSKDLAQFRIPLPPMEIQKHVIEVLDSFSELEVDLELELETRRKQFHLYRTQLLTFSGQEVEWLSMAEVADINRGASPRPIREYLVDQDGGIPWIKIGDVDPESKYLESTSQFVSAEGASKSREINPGDFILTNSMSFGRPYISKIHGCIHDGWLAISNFSANLNSDYLYHLLRSDQIQKEFNRRVGDGSIQNLNAEIVRSVVIPIPPLSRQLLIADKLDKFELLVSDVNSGIPGELTARRKQSEYYRDKLLTFKELAA